MNKRRISISTAVLIGVAAIVLLAVGCESLRDAVDVMRKPEVRIAGSELEALSFSGLTLRFDVEIKNPNPIGIGLSGFDYELQIEDNPFVSGQVQDKVTISARDRSIIPLPVELGFEEIAQTIDALAPGAGKEEAAYRLSSGFSFDLPILGKIRIPVETEGSFPILRMPGLQVVGLRLNEISLSGARLVLDLELINRNSFKVFVESLEYRFQVDGQDWASGMRQERVRIPENDSIELTIPIDLDFGALGRGVYQLILGGERLQYVLEANVEAGTSLRGLKEASLPFELSGQLSVGR
jgi:LEA14-like dessication related protein